MFRFLQDHNVFTYFRISIWSQLSNNNVFYHHSDHLGTSELISDSLGNVVWHADYDAFGSVMNQIDNQTFSPVFTGRFFDKTTNLYYFNACWYDCELGRFTTQDPAREGLKYRVVTYHAFNSDGFWDIYSNKGDGIGPKKELPGGTPYSYIPYTLTEAYKK